MPEKYVEKVQKGTQKCGEFMNYSNFLAITFFLSVREQIEQWRFSNLIFVFFIHNHMA